MVPLSEVQVENYNQAVQETFLKARRTSILALYVLIWKCSVNDMDHIFGIQCTAQILDYWPAGKSPFMLKKRLCGTHFSALQHCGWRLTGGA